VVFSFLVRNHHDPSHEPAPWPEFAPDLAAGDAYLDQATRLGEPAGAARSAGLRRLSRLTWRATQLGALATVGFATLFARTAPAATVTSPPHPTPSVTVSRPSPSPSPSPARTHRRRPHHHHHRRVTPSAAPSAAAPSSAAPSPTLAPPTTPPAPPPPSPKPSPVHSSSSPSHHGGG
jgi:hypothetical protein